MLKIIYPNEKPSIRTGNIDEVFCVVRRGWYLLTPEEWVRQNFLLYLIHTLKYPASLIAVEKQLYLGELKKRFDILIYKNSLPFMVVECKEMNVELKEDVLLQALRYNTKINANFIVITNGIYCAAFEKNGSELISIDKLPLF